MQRVPRSSVAGEDRGVFVCGMGVETMCMYTVQASKLAALAPVCVHVSTASIVSPTRAQQLSCVMYLSIECILLRTTTNVP